MRRKTIVITLVLAACVPPHVALRVPPNATPEQRVATYSALAAESEKTTWTRSCSSACMTTISKELRLANGTTVHYPEDLLPVVSPNSVTAHEVQHALTARRRSRYASLFAVASCVGLAAVGWHWFRSADTRESIDPTTGEAIGLGTAALGAIVSGVFIWYYEGKYAHHFGEANLAYNDGLAEQLNVCVAGYALVPCETVLPQSSASAPHGSSPGRDDAERR
jgi:hypothetical protein